MLTHTLSPSDCCLTSTPDFSMQICPQVQCLRALSLPLSPKDNHPCKQTKQWHSANIHNIIKENHWKYEIRFGCFHWTIERYGLLDSCVSIKVFFSLFSKQHGMSVWLMPFGPSCQTHPTQLILKSSVGHFSSLYNRYYSGQSLGKIKQS